MTTHQDNFADETRHTKQDRVSEFRTFNSAATDDIVISHPGEGRQEIELQKPLLVAMARENRDVPDSNDDGQIDAIFDEALCDVAELALASAGVDESQITLPKLRALMIQVARDIDSFGELSTYVSRYSVSEIERFELHSDYSSSTYRKAAKQLKTVNRFESVVDATFIAVHALFWNGVSIPEPVKDQYNLSYDAGPAATEFSTGARQLALYNLVDDLLAIVTDNLDFHRGSNKSRDLRSLIGIFAHAAHNGASIENYQRSANHSFNLDSAFAGPTVRTHIDSLHLWQIEEMFDDINQALLEYIIKSDVMSKPAMVSYDLTDVQSLGLKEYDEKFLTADGRWRFASLSFTDPDLEFSFGLRLLESEGNRAPVLKNLLRNLTAMVEIKLFMADRGFDGQEDIEACRAFVPGHWLICAQDYSDTHGHSDDYARLREKIEPGGTAYLRSAGYDDLHPPVQMIGYSGASEDAETPNPIRAFYTDISVPSDKDERKKWIQNTNFRYNQRGKIESLFRMAKNKFDVSTETDKKERKAFYFHMSVLFYNLYNIVNTVPSPEHGVELDTTQTELLTVTRNLAFHGPTRPDALDYWSQQS
ncbi:transposase [Halobacteriaceae archaeon SHR40]|uniref:transposase n=1 Tax=Halovenus amylolytica TaxID=2500550 RepID=UPI000FE301DF